MKSKRIVITGGPGTGKTAIIKNLETRGFYCFHEVVRSLTFEAKKNGDPATFVSNPLAFVDDPYLFNQKILEGRIAHFNEASQVKKDIIFYDRGLPDVLAYMKYFGQPYGDDYTSHCHHHRYDEVIVLPPWEEIYITDHERLETFEEAKEIHKCLEETYADFKYDSIKVPRGSIEERTTFILNILAKSL